MYLALFLVSVFIASISQILLKKSALKSRKGKLREYLNLTVITAYGLFFLSMLATFFAYRGVNVSLGPILESTAYIYVTLMSVVFLKEKVNVKLLIGLLLIITGIFVFVFF